LGELGIEIVSSLTYWLPYRTLSKKYVIVKVYVIRSFTISNILLQNVTIF